MTEYQEIFKNIINIADTGRPGYKDSLGKGVSREIISKVLNPSFEGSHNIPEVYFEIYELIAGTPRGIKNQKHMDFIPGYHLIALDELSNLVDNFQESPNYLPLLANYSSDFICFSTETTNKDDGGVFLALHDEPDIERIHKYDIDFVKTTLQFYQQNIYFIDEDGYLESNDEKEDEVGLLMNPEIEYWSNP